MLYIGFYVSSTHAAQLGTINFSRQKKNVLIYTFFICINCIQYHKTRAKIPENKVIMFAIFIFNFFFTHWLMKISVCCALSITIRGHNFPRRTSKVSTRIKRRHTKSLIDDIRHLLRSPHQCRRLAQWHSPSRSHTRLRI